MRARLAGPAAVAMVVALLAGCGTSTPAPATSGAAPATPAPSSDTSSPRPSRSIVLASGETPAPSAESDPGLFAIIRGDASELDFRYDAQTTATVAADPALARDAAALAIGLYTVRGQRAPAEDFAIVSIVQLRDPAADADWFRSYRDSYDESACAQAGGVARHAQATLNGHPVFIGGCAGGAFTYHVRTGDGAIVVSITGFGPAEIGLRLAGDVGKA